MSLAILCYASALRCRRTARHRQRGDRMIRRREFVTLLGPGCRRAADWPSAIGYPAMRSLGLEGPDVIPSMETAPSTDAARRRGGRVAARGAGAAAGDAGVRLPSKRFIR